jgi:8-hydroxy-5-deazaflavin:NADPH oxidoreductase
MSDVRTIGIIGAGKLGITLARIARHYGLAVNIAGSDDPKKIALTAEVLAPGAKAMSTQDVVNQSDIVILALPLGKFRTLPKLAFASKLVIDAMNHWWEVDGERSAIVPDEVSSSEGVQKYLADARVVKAFNHIGYHDLFDEHKPRGAKGRKAVAIAGDDARDVQIVSELVDNLGFDPVVIGGLAEGRCLEPGTNVFGVSAEQQELKKLLSTQHQLR